MPRQPYLPILFVPVLVAVQWTAFAQTISPGLARMLNSTGAVDVVGDEDARPGIATDGMGNWVAVWESQYDITQTGATRSDILVARSTDNGATWSTAALLNSTGGDTRLDTNARIVTDRGGTWIAYWLSIPELGPTDYDLFYSRSNDNGASWSPVALLNTNGNVDSFDDRGPHLVGDGTVNWIAVWNGISDLGDDLDHDIFMSRSTDDGITWTSPAPMDVVDTGFDQDAWVATDREGNWLVAWSSLHAPDATPEANKYENFVVRSTDNGVTWSTRVRINPLPELPNTAIDGAPQLMTDERGIWMAMWSIRPFPYNGDFQVVCAHSSDNGLTWTQPSTIAIDLKPYSYGSSGDVARNGNMVTNRNGTWMVLWQRVHDTPQSYIYGAISQDNGASWGLSIRIGNYPSINLRADMHPEFATDTQGNWVAVWQTMHDFDSTAFFEYEIATTHWRLLAPDADQDLLPDAVETNTGTFTNASDTGTDPNNPDTDGDGYLDGIEVALGTDPNDPLDFPTGLPLKATLLMVTVLVGLGAVLVRRNGLQSDRQ